ncbi:MAG: Mut7-C RNAse domain-containing protein [Candidatus Zixiibacteriota bacterium]
MRFICDDNLGKLATYLRVLGYDTLFKSLLSVSDTLFDTPRIVFFRPEGFRDNLISGRDEGIGLRNPFAAASDAPRDAG